MTSFFSTFVRRNGSWLSSRRRCDQLEVAEASVSRSARSVRRLLERLEDDEPALAVHARAPGQCDREGEIQRWNLPAMAGPAGLERHEKGLQQVLWRGVVAMVVLDALEDGKFAFRPEVH